MTTLLIIEDDATIRDNVETLLGFRGYTCVTAPDGQAGIARFHEYHPDLIICDVNMPRMDGYAVLSEVRSLSYGARVPFIFLTANKNEADIRRGMLSGADDYISKPFNDDDLLSAVQLRLEKQQQTETAILQMLTGRMLQDNDAFKHRLATLLKTDIIERFNTAQILLDAFARQNSTLQNPSLLNEVTALLQVARTASEQLYLRLTPEHLKGLGLIATVHWLIAQHYDETTPAITFHHQNLPANVPDVIQQHMVAILDGLIQNSIQHSTAHNITLHMHTQDEMLHISVEDDGVGFDVDAFWQNVKTLGLVMVRERVHLCGGRLAIISQVDTGTSVHVTLNLAGDKSSVSDALPLPLTLDAPTPVETVTEPTLSVVIAHSHALTLNGLAHIITTAPNLSAIATCDNPRAFTNLLADGLQPDVLLVGVDMWQALDDSAQTNAKETSRVVLLANNTHLIAHDALEADAIQGYLHEYTVVDDLVSLLEQVAQGKHVYKSAPTPVIEDGNLLERLTRRERQVLDYVAQGYQNADIAEELVISIRTVETHRANMMHKLNLKEKADLIKFALKYGIIS
ncbi:MAG: response regulator, partial [Chloroflexota bacterium]